MRDEVVLSFGAFLCVGDALIYFWVKVASAVEWACAFANADFIISAALDGRQWHTELSESVVALCRGWDWAPITTIARKTVTKMARRRVAWSSDGRYGGCVMG
jgi:hypothetical protein